MNITPTRTIPVELAQARATAKTAWALYNSLCGDDQASYDVRHAAGNKAEQCTRNASDWYERWQKLGGTSDIESIVEAESEGSAEASMQARADQLEAELNDPFMTKKNALPALDELARLYDRLDQ